MQKFSCQKDKRKTEKKSKYEINISQNCEKRNEV